MIDALNTFVGHLPSIPLLVAFIVAYKAMWCAIFWKREQDLQWEKEL